MAKRLTLVLAVLLFVFFTSGAIWCAKDEPKKSTPIPLLTEEELTDYLISKAPGILYNDIVSHYDTILDYTWQEVQHMTRIPRMNANDYQTNRGLHFTFADLQEDQWIRYVDYNYWDYEGWTRHGAPPPSYAVSAGARRAGYSGVDVFRPLDGYFKSHSRAVICYHTTGPVFPDPERTYSVLSIEPDLPGYHAMRGDSFWYDIPDCFTDSGLHGCGPVCGIDSLNRIHVVMKEGTSPEGVSRLGYTRCYEITDDSIVCESPWIGEYRIAKQKYYTNQNWGVAIFGRSSLPTQIVATSKVSNRVALVWTDLAETLVDSTGANVFNCNDVFYVESHTGGDDWLDGEWPPPRINITRFRADDYGRAYGDISALYDLNDSLHVFWVQQFYDQEDNEIDTSTALLWHWSKATERNCDGQVIPWNQVANAHGHYVYPGKYNRLISKVQSGVGIVDSTIDPNHYNKNYLYLQWTQFNEGTQSGEGYNQGDIYVSASVDRGMTWQPPVNVTNSSVPWCLPGQCASDHWSSMAERVDTCVHMQWIYDRDAGSQGYPSPLDQGEVTNNEVLYRCFPTDSIPLVNMPRISWCPLNFVKRPIHIPVGGTDTVYLELQNIGTGGLSVFSISTGASWLAIYPTGAIIAPASCPTKIALRINGQGSEGFYVDSVRIQSNDLVGNNDVYVRLHMVESDVYTEPEFVTISNPTFCLSESNTGNLGHANETAGFYLHQDVNEPNFLYDGSALLAFTTPSNDSVVGRHIFDHEYLLPETELVVDTSANLKTIVVEAEFSPVTPQVPLPWHHRWWYWTIRTKDYMFYSQAPTDKKEQYVTLRYIQLYYNPPPPWWPDITTPPSITPHYLGMGLDIDAPSDSAFDNYPGSDESRRMAYLRGYGGGVNENYRMAIAQKDTCFEFESGVPPEVKLACWPKTQNDAPCAMHILRNDSTVYPQGGYSDTMLYRWMSSTGYSIQGAGEEEDYNIVATGRVIPAQTFPASDTYEVAYALVVSDEYDMDKLNACVDMIKCGNANRDNKVDIMDVVYFMNYLFKNGPEIWVYMGDANADGQATISDLVYLINYLIRSGPPPQCSSL